MQQWRSVAGCGRAIKARWRARDSHLRGPNTEADERRILWVQSSETQQSLCDEGSGEQKQYDSHWLPMMHWAPLITFSIWLSFCDILTFSWQKKGACSFLGFSEYGHSAWQRCCMPCTQRQAELDRVNGKNMFNFCHTGPKCWITESILVSKLTE